MGPVFKKYGFQINLVFNILLVTMLATLLLFNLFKIDVSQEVFGAVLVTALIPVFIATFNALRKRKVSVDFLALVALVFAFLAHEWYSAAFINLMLASARIFDLWTQRRSENLVKSLLKYRPEKVKVKNGDSIEIKNVDDIKVGDIIIIANGERIAVDAVVISGQASIDESTLTGESEPVVKKAGDHVFSSTLNISGSLIVNAEKIAGESTLAKIISLVEKSTLNKSKTVRTVDRFSQWYIIATFLGALVIFFVTRNVNFVLAILLIVCADDIAVSVPLAFMAAISKAAQSGILIKSSDVLERLPKIDTIITDKTGTLTFAKPKVTKIITFGNFTRKRFLSYLASIESNSTHPLSKSVLQYVKGENVTVSPISVFKETPGEGIVATLNNESVIAGKIGFLKAKGIRITQSEQKVAERISESGFSSMFLGIGKELAGFAVFEDEPKPYIKNVIRQTKELGVKLWIMITGDNASVAKKVADSCGIDVYEANLDPKEKVDFIEKYKRQNKDKTVSMIGDGINDAAALALADVSFAMGAVGSDVAINAADVALMTDNLGKIPDAIILGRKTREIVYQNFAIWGITNVVGLILVFGGVLSPTGAATYNFLTDFVPIFNALRVGVRKI